MGWDWMEQELVQIGPGLFVELCATAIRRLLGSRHYAGHLAIVGASRLGVWSVVLNTDRGHDAHDVGRAVQIQPTSIGLGATYGNDPARNLHWLS